MEVDIEKLKKDKKVFFIVGAPRSGTSLLSRMLNSHPAIAVPPESLIFNVFSGRRKSYNDLSELKNQKILLDDILKSFCLKHWEPKVPNKLAKSLIEREGFSAVFDAILTAWAYSQNKSHWGEKTPGHVFYWKEIAEFYPEAKFLHIVRDGRDTCLSLLKARFGPKTIYAGAKLWVKYLDEITNIRSHVDTNKFLDIKYEDLTSQPEEVLQNVCAFLDEEYSSKMLEFHKNQSPYKTDATNEKNLHRPLFETNTKKWETVMDENDQRIYESIAREKLAEFNYELVDSAAVISDKEEKYFKYVSGPTKRIVAMARNKQGYVEEFNIKTIMLRRKVLNLLAMCTKDH